MDLFTALFALDSLIVTERSLRQTGLAPARKAKTLQMTRVPDSRSKVLRTHGAGAVTPFSSSFPFVLLFHTTGHVIEYRKN
ncbi:MAG: hypothetical protein KJN62_00765 [Deltaproteobacteria bacterium]|nr:hypothetical protein [Deltaproteobacteria bacterium]